MTGKRSTRSQSRPVPATAKGLGLALGKPIIEVPTLAGIAYNLGFVRGLVCPVMDARRQQVYSGIYRFEGDRLITVRDQTPVSVTELIAELEGLDDALTSEGIIFLGDGVPVLREEADRTLSVPHTYAPAHLCMQRAGGCAALRRGKICAGRKAYSDLSEKIPGGAAA